MTVQQCVYETLTFSTYSYKDCVFNVYTLIETGGLSTFDCYFPENVIILSVSNAYGGVESNHRKFLFLTREWLETKFSSFSVEFKGFAVIVFQKQLKQYAY